MDATLGFILIFVLAVVLIAVGLGLARRAKREERIPGERPPARPVSPAAPTATLPPPVEVEEAPEVVAPAPPPPLRERLGKTRAAFAKLRGRARVDDETWDDLEDTLLMADVGMPVTERILGDVKDRARAERTGDSDALMALLHRELVALLDDGDKPRTLVRTEGEPNVWMFVGVNGV